MGAESLALPTIQAPDPVQLGRKKGLAEIVDQRAGDNRLDRLTGQTAPLGQVGQAHVQSDAVLRQLLGVDDATQTQTDELRIQVGGHPSQAPADAAARQRWRLRRCCTLKEQR